MSWDGPGLRLLTTWVSHSKLFWGGLLVPWGSALRLELRLASRGLALLNADGAARDYQLHPAILRSSRGRRVVGDGVAHAVAGRGDVVSG